MRGSYPNRANADSRQASTTGLTTAVILFAVFGIVLVEDFAFSDDYWLLALVRRHSLASFHAEVTPINGRLIGNTVLYFAFKLAGSIAGLAVIRALSLSIVAGVAGTIAAYLVRRGWGRLHAAAVAIILFTTPSIQVVVSWAACFAAAVALALAFLATVCLRRASISRGWHWPLLAQVCLSMALQCHQGWALFLIPFALGLLLTCATEDSRMWRRLLAWAAAVFAVAMALALFLMRLIAPAEGRLALTSEPLEKLDWFVRTPLLNAASWLLLQPSAWLALTMGGVIAAGIVASHLRGDRRRRDGLLIGVLALPAAYAANLVSADVWPSYRSIGPLTATVLVLALAGLNAALGVRVGVPLRSPGDPVVQTCRPAEPSFAFCDWIRLGPVVALAVLALLACVMAYWNVSSYVVRPQQAERALFADELARLVSGQTRHIHIILPKDEHRPTDFWTHDEFGQPSILLPWVPAAMLELVAEQIGPAMKNAVRSCSLSFDWEIVSADPDVLQIDMRRLREFRRR